MKEEGVRVRIFPTYDAAVDWAEDQIVYRHGGFSQIGIEADLSGQALLAGLSPQELADFSRLGTRVVFDAGTRIIDASEPPAKVYFLVRGMVSARSLNDVRLSTMIPGMAFGELALIDQPRSADVWADTEAICLEISAEQFRAFQETHARAADRIMRNLAILLAGRVRMATARIDMLTG
ncbi:cyclic nucleotide-binding domain-containing protein [Xanthobacter autotrophicus]|nr:cyclic nucleotide-binding domain-containing protein [Xanthobacter autotrophicus]